MKGLADLFKKNRQNGRRRGSLLSAYSHGYDEYSQEFDTSSPRLQHYTKNKQQQEQQQHYYHHDRRRIRATNQRGEARKTTRPRRQWSSMSSSSSSAASGVAAEAREEAEGRPFYPNSNSCFSSSPGEESRNSFSYHFSRQRAPRVIRSRNHGKHGRRRKDRKKVMNKRQENRYGQRNERRRSRSRSRKTRKHETSYPHSHDHRPSSSSSISSTELLTREELFELPARALRKKCKKLGLDTANIAEKKDLVLLIHEYYRKLSIDSSSTRSTARGNRQQADMVSTTLSSSSSPNNHHATHTTKITSNAVVLPNDENEQMIEVLFEILPYYAQGDSSIDCIVKDTIQRLPYYCIERRDPLAGNTLLIISCQIGATELVEMLLTKGANVNVQNANGETCLHFVCYNDSYSQDIAKVSSSQV